MSAPVQATPAERLDRVIASLRAVVAECGLASGLAGALIVLLSARLARLAARFAAYAEAAPGARRPARTQRRDSSPSPLPRRFAWLLRAIPATATARAQLATLLAEPDMRALIQSRPATGRALRPLCHLLGIPRPPSLRLQRRTRAPGPEPARSPARTSSHNAPRPPFPESCSVRTTPWHPPRGNRAWTAFLGLGPDTG